MRWTIRCATSNCAGNALRANDNAPWGGLPTYMGEIFRLVFQQNDGTMPPTDIIHFTPFLQPLECVKISPASGLRTIYLKVGSIPASRTILLLLCGTLRKPY